MNLRMSHLASIWIVLLVLAAAGLQAQQRIEGEPGEREGNVFFKRVIAGPQIMPGQGAGFIAETGPADQVMYISTEMGVESRIVQGAPYSAEAMSEHVQTLGDGNRITNQSKSSVYRDGQGRTRRVQTPAAVGPWGAFGNLPESVFINDPVAGVSYILDTRSQTARKISLPQPGSAGLLAGPGPRPPFNVEAGATFERALPQPRIESLGRQFIEGVAADGTRTTITIPAGEIGNERPIEIVTERWFSPDLQMMVMSRHSDPRMGENTYRLVGINRGEPDPALFRVPDGYRIVEGPGLQMFQKPLEGMKR